MRSSTKRPHNKLNRAANDKGAAIIKCAGCQNIFRARPREAICLKCKRPANLPLTTAQKALSVALFPWGVIQAFLLRPSRPYAAGQAALSGAVGAALWAGLFLLIRVI